MQQKNLILFLYINNIYIIIYVKYYWMELINSANVSMKFIFSNSVKTHQ